MAIGPSPDVSGNVSPGAICVSCSGGGGWVAPNPNGAYPGVTLPNQPNRPTMTVLGGKKPAPAAPHEPQGPDSISYTLDDPGGTRGGNRPGGGGRGGGIGGGGRGPGGSGMGGGVGRGTPGFGFPDPICFHCDTCGNTADSKAPKSSPKL